MADPQRRAKARPVELLVLSGVLGLFAGLVVFISTRVLVEALIGLGVAFVVSLVVFAMISLATSPPPGDDTPDAADGTDGPQDPAR
jgi:hypothetical protein